MLIIDNNNYNPWFNLASEEYLFRNFTDDIFMLYINDRSVIIGKHQNPAEEVNVRCLRGNNIPMIRRISGGGAVYHDKGNLNYTFIRNSDDGKQVDFSAYIIPIISFLKEEGVDAYAGDKNEIRTEGMKISGNAEHVFKNRVLHHGTILYSANLDIMSECLERPSAIIKSRAVQSNRATVCNLQNMMPEIKDIYELRKKLLDYISSANSGSETYMFSKNDIDNIQRLEKEKFVTWDWNYAWGPDYTFLKEFNIEENKYIIELVVSKGIIRKCKYSGPASWNKIEYLLPGNKHNYDELASVMSGNGLTSDSDLIYNFLM